jgi:hypothetical protein
VVVPETTATRWAAAIEELLDDAPRRRRMSVAAAQRAQRYSLANTFDAFWGEHLRACEQASLEPANVPMPAVVPP